jgi:hypothetical protein
MFRSFAASLNGLFAGTVPEFESFHLVPADAAAIEMLLGELAKVCGDS